VSRDRPGALVLRVLTVVSAGLLVLAGCADAPSEAAAPAPSPPPLRTIGSLADGFEIEPGSGLVGAVFPLGSPTGSADGWQAVLRVDGDAERVFDGYVRQAEELGHSMESGWCCRPEREWCSRDVKPGPFPVSCTAFTHPPDVVSLALSLRGSVDADGRGYVHVRADRVDTVTEPLPPVPDGEGAPATDVEVAPGLTFEPETPVRVVEGSAPISEPLPPECATGGYVAVLQVTGELAPVLRGYEEQFTGAGFGSDEGLSGTDDVLRVSTSAAGGGTLSAVAVAGDPAFLLLERCND
jgi:hypothetical protein